MSEGAGTISTTLDLVGPRLRRVREQRGMTLTDAAQRTSISKSTLSRLENGQRKPSLELLLPLAQVYRVPLDDLVGAPDVGDPRVRLKPRRVNGRTVIPLTHPGGVQAWKLVIPTSQSRPDPRIHDGFEWLYVLAGRMRLILGEQDLVLGVGEAAQFDTQVPHWFGSTGDGPAEVLSIFGRPGERMHVRTEGRVMPVALVETKFFVPQERSGLVPRPRLEPRAGRDPADAGLRAGRLREDHPAHRLAGGAGGRGGTADRVGLAGRLRRQAGRLLDLRADRARAVSPR